MGDYERGHRPGGGDAGRRGGGGGKTGKPGARTKVGEVYGDHARRASPPEPQLPVNCPPAIPKNMSIVSLDTGGLGGVTRDRWRDHLQGEVFQNWTAINEIVSADLWKQQLLVEPKVVIQPGADAEDRFTRARSWLGIAAEFATCEPISQGESPTYEGAFLWTISINNQAVDVIRAGFVQFELPDQSLDAEDTFALPVEEAGAPGSDAALKAPRTSGRETTDAVVDVGILALPWEFQGAARERLTDDVRQVLHDAIASIAQSDDYGPKVLAEVWDSIKDNWPEFVALTTGLIVAEITAAALMAAPEGTVTKIIGIIINAIIIAFLVYAVVTEGAEVIHQGITWWTLVKEANGDPKKIAAAAETFARVVLHLILALMAAAGLRSKVAGTVPKMVTREGKPFFKSQLRELAPEEAERPPPAIKGDAPETPAPSAKASERVAAEELPPLEKPAPASPKEAQILKDAGMEWTDLEVRNYYLHENARIAGLSEQWKAAGLSAKERAYKAWEIRHNARLTGRAMMKDPAEVRKLQVRDFKKYQNTDGPTFEYEVNKYQSRGFKGDDVYEEIVKGAQETDAATNTTTGIKGKGGTP